MLRMMVFIMPASILDGYKMKLIVCLDDENGMSFHHRRLSRDRVINKDILNYKPLIMNSYSYKMFEDKKDIFLEETLPIESDIYQFIENKDINKYVFDEMIIYYFNKRYPSDIQFHNIDQYDMIDEIELEGYSHEVITKRIYRRKL